MPRRHAARADAETQARRRPSRTLLHRDRGSDRISSGRERHHQAVAQPLNLVTAVRDYRIAQELVMGPEDALGIFIAHPLQKISGIDEVGEEQGDSARMS